MPFLISDSLESREQRIRQYLDEGEPVIAVLLAAADCERTIRRAIVALSALPTATIRKKLTKRGTNSISGYGVAWERYVRPHREWALDGEVVDSYDELKKAFKLRNTLVHGEQGRTGVEYSGRKVETILKATRSVTELAQGHGVDLMERITVRQRPRPRRRS